MHGLQWQPNAKQLQTLKTVESPQRLLFSALDREKIHQRKQNAKDVADSSPKACRDSGLSGCCCTVGGHLPCTGSLQIPWLFRAFLANSFYGDCGRLRLSIDACNRQRPQRDQINSGQKLGKK
jgi:hypothetical protein